jgi:ABC-type transport system involved in multi-copper enzyme maturation permease subunit
MNPATVWTVFRFEIGRILTLPRLAIGAALTLFPVALLALMVYHGANLSRPQSGSVALFVLIPEMLCLMSILLWATPVIHAEVEGKTWAYLAVRPAGKGPILLGKYLAAVAWTGALALVSLTISVAIIHPENGSLFTWLVFARLIVFSCFAYSAIFVLLGVVFLRRGMLAAVAYTVVFEVLVAFIPAVINQFTVQYHLRCLLIQSMPEVAQNLRGLFGDNPWWQHVLILAAMTVVALSVAAAVLRQRELVRGDAD